MHRLVCLILLVALVAWQVYPFLREAGRTLQQFFAHFQPTNDNGGRLLVSVAMKASVSSGVIFSPPVARLTKPWISSTIYPKPSLDLILFQSHPFLHKLRSPD